VPGPITQALQRAFFGLFDGSTRDEWGWLDHVGVAAAGAPSAGAERAPRTETLHEAVA
jgi:branched-chain amino acid aminotransferase